MREWVSGILYASVISSVALTLVPAGRVKSITRLCCGVLCALALAGPLLELDPESMAVGMAAYEQAAASVVQSAEEEAKIMERSYIEERCEAYILAKGNGSVVSAAVTARWDEASGVWYPYAVALAGEYSDALSVYVEGELGIPADRQSWEAKP